MVANCGVLGFCPATGYSLDSSGHFQARPDGSSRGLFIGYLPLTEMAFGNRRSNRWVYRRSQLMVRFIDLLRQSGGARKGLFICHWHCVYPVPTPSTLAFIFSSSHLPIFSSSHLLIFSSLRLSISSSLQIVQSVIQSFRSS